MNILLATQAPIVRDETTPINVMDAGGYNDGAQDWSVYLCAEDHTGLYAGSKLLGIWNNDGSVLETAPGVYYPIDLDYQTYLRPIGNETVEGVATGPLNYQYWLGNQQRYLQSSPAQNTLPQYPADNQPIILRMDRRFDDTPGFEGQGWVATIEFADPNRPPNARAIGIYDENWSFIYTTGAFVLTELGQGYRWQPHREMADSQSSGTRHGRS